MLAAAAMCASFVAAFSYLVFNEEAIFGENHLCLSSALGGGFFLKSAILARFLLPAIGLVFVFKLVVFGSSKFFVFLCDLIKILINFAQIFTQKLNRHIEDFTSIDMPFLQKYLTID